MSFRAWLVFLVICSPVHHTSSRPTSTGFVGMLRAQPASRHARSLCVRAPWGCRPAVCRQRYLKMNFDRSHAVGRLEHDMKADLAVLAQKFGTMIESVEDIEEVRISDIDGDHMSLEVVYCDRGEQTCVAVAVPIVFPYHCDTEECLVDVIHELEEMKGDEIDMGDSFQLTKKPISPELAETIARISVVMNRDFQEELTSFVRVFGGVSEDTATGQCEMCDLTPDGFIVKSALLIDTPVRVTFPRECLTAEDFQKQILMLSEEAMTY